MSLRLRYSPDTDGTGELHGTVEANGFAGASAAWFSKQQLLAFCDALTVYPLPSDKPPTIAGGYWSDDDALAVTLLSIRIAPFNPLGALRVAVELVAPDEPEEHSHSLRTWFLVGYNDVDRFQTAFRRVLAGNADEARLLGTLTG